MTPTHAKNSGNPAKSLKLQEIAELVEGELVGDREILITGVAGIKEAKEGDISFLSHPKYLHFLNQTQASAVITSKDVISKNKPLVRTSNPSQAFTKVISYFASPVINSKPAGIHSTAMLGQNVRLGEEVSIGPYTIVEDGAAIGDRSALRGHVFVGARCQIGQDVFIHPNVAIYDGSKIGDRVIIHSGSVIGSDGFGYETVDGVHLKIPHTGNVWIEDDVEIGANVCVDRGRFDKTWIKKGVKIDNLVQIAHNVVIGEHSLIISQAGISGSTQLGKNVIVAGQAGLVGHITLGDQTVVAARSGVTKSFPAGSVILGEPARPALEQKKIFAVIARLPELFKELSEIKKKLKK